MVQVERSERSLIHSERMTRVRGCHQGDPERVRRGERVERHDGRQVRRRRSVLDHRGDQADRCRRDPDRFAVTTAHDQSGAAHHRQEVHPGGELQAGFAALGTAQDGPDAEEDDDHRQNCVGGERMRSQPATSLGHADHSWTVGLRRSVGLVQAS
jgi:hypothetical protein